MNISNAEVETRDLQFPPKRGLFQHLVHLVAVGNDLNRASSAAVCEDEDST